MKKHFLKRFIDIHVLILCAVFKKKILINMAYFIAINNVNVSDDS